jgi:hypothetical protein
MRRESVGLARLPRSPDPNDVDVVIAGLQTRPLRTSEIAAEAPPAPGLYAWWASPANLPKLKGPVLSAAVLWTGGRYA